MVGQEDMADSSRSAPADPDAADCRTASPLTLKKRSQQSPGLRPKYLSSAPGHCLKKVTLTKPTFCHSCSDFIWGLVGFLCEGKTAQDTSCIIYNMNYLKHKKLDLVLFISEYCILVLPVGIEPPTPAGCAAAVSSSQVMLLSNCTDLM